MTTQLLGAVADGSGEVNESDVVDVTGIAYGGEFCFVYTNS